MKQSSEFKARFRKFVASVAMGKVKSSGGSLDAGLAQLRVSEMVKQYISQFQQEIVDELRKSPEVTWSDIAEASGLSVGAAVARWQVEKPVKAAAKAELPGISVDQAARELGIYASTVRARVAANLDATWHERVSVSGPRGSQVRILDIQALVDAGRRQGKRQ